MIYSFQLSKLNTTKGDEKMPMAGMCPYFLKDNGLKAMYCECIRIKFPDKQSRRDIVFRYCAHPDGYRDCVFKKMMDEYYERKYMAIDEKAREICKSESQSVSAVAKR